MNLRILCVGIFMGIADLVPGISGGSVAFISGIYEPFLKSFKGLSRGFFLKLFTLRFKEAFQNSSFLFLLSLFSGLFLAAVSFSHVIGFCLSRPQIKPYLYAFFLGLIAHSLKDVFHEIPNWDRKKIGFGLIGIISGMSLLLFSQQSFSREVVGIDMQIILCGFLAISAMLLPGISGSYVLLIFGLYTPFIYSLSHLFEMSSWVFLLNLGLGIVAGLLISSRAILWLLQRFRENMLCWLLGLIAGSLFSFFPEIQMLEWHFIGQILISLFGFFVFTALKKIAYKDQIFL